MKSTRRQSRRLTEKEVDYIVAPQANDDSAWEKPIKVRRAKAASLSIPAELAARAAFLAKLHRENNVEDRLKKVIKERVELEEVAYNEAKRENVVEKRRVTTGMTQVRLSLPSVPRSCRTAGGRLLFWGYCKMCFLIPHT